MPRPLVAPRLFVPAILLSLACSPTAPSPDGGAAAGADAGVDAEAVDAQVPGPDAAAPVAVGLELPPGAGWSDGGLPSIEASVCPEGDAGCEPAWRSQVRWTLNGQGFTSIGVMVVPEEGYATSVTAGPATMQWRFVMAHGGDTMSLRSATQDVALLHYPVVPAWGGVTTLPFVGTGLSGANGRSFLFRYEPYDLKATHGEIHGGLEEIASRESAVVGRPAVAFTAFLLPTELAIPLGYEGNISYGNGVVGINYGNPGWIAAMGGVRKLVEWEFSHEYAHEHFVETGKAFAISPTCLNEGLADALGNRLGYVPDSDFCPDADASGECDFVPGCQAITGHHARGNCLLWQFKQAGLLDDAFLKGTFNPARTGYSFDSCDFTSETTGNSYVVYFSEALGPGMDASRQVTRAGIPNAGSYEAARAALGW